MPRLIESFVDLFSSTKFYISELFELNISGNITINDFTKQPFEMPFNLPSTWEEFKLLCHDYWNLFTSKENIMNYINFLGDVAYYLSKLIMVFMPFVILIMILLNKDEPINNDYNRDSKQLIWWRKNIENKVYLPIKNWLIGFANFLKENSFYTKLWLVIWMYNFNILTMIIELISYYLYFVSSMDLISLYRQVLKFLMDSSIAIDFIPPIGWACITLTIINMIRRNIGYNKLNHMEMKDRGFINERPIVIMLNGTMGSKKTTIITDMALSQEIMLRDKAFEKILENDLKFPFFPWVNLENSLKGAIKHHYVYNLATCRKWVLEKKARFEKRPCMRHIFLYVINPNRIITD